MTVSAQSGLESIKKNPVILFLDFDGTITKKDTLHLVAEVAYVQQQKSGLPSTALPPWEHFGQAYMRDLKEHEQNYTPRREERRSVQEEIAWLRSLRAVEEASINRAIDSGLFEMNNPFPAMTSVLQEHKQSIAVRPGLVGLISKIHQQDFLVNRSQPATATFSADSKFSPCHILSVNWSRYWIKSVLNNVDLEQISASDIDRVKSDYFDVFANEVYNLSLPTTSTTSKKADESGKHVSTSEKSKPEIKCTTSQDKVLRMRKVVEQFIDQSSHEKDNYERISSVYIGDSATDLECLLEADVGICIRAESVGTSQKDLLETCQRIGVSQSHISEAHPSNNSSSQQLWWARDFDEVSRWLDNVADQNR